MRTLIALLLRLLRLAGRAVRPGPGSGDGLDGSGAGAPDFLASRAQPAAADARARLERAGVRCVPYPFAGIVALVSDVDGSTRARFRTYVGHLVGRLGLDFGDSVRLLHVPARHGTSGHALCPADCFVPPFHGDDPPGRHSLSGFEVLREHYLGNVDHVHGIVSRGPKLIALPVPRAAATRQSSVVEVPVPARLTGREATARGPLRTVGMPVMGVAIQAGGGAVPAGTGVSLETAAGRLPLRPVDGADPGWRPRFSSDPDATPALFELDETAGRLPVVDDVERVRVAFADERPVAAIEGVYLLSCHRPLLRRLLDVLSGTFNFRSNLYTDHGGQYFYNRGGEQSHARRIRQRLEHPKRFPPFALYGSVKANGVHYSCMGDDPESFAYLLPELKSRLGLRFVNAAGSSGLRGVRLRVTEAVAPARARDGSSVYVAARVMPALGDEQAPHPLEEDTRVSSIGPRLAQALRVLEAEAHTVWPLYTHIGNMTRAEGPAQHDAYERHVRHEAFTELQDRVFNVSGRVSPRARAWFVRASMLYDYDLMAREIADHVRRPDANTVVIEPWRDPCLKQELPASPAQLNGLTFYVARAARARVLLGEEEIHELVRNRADASGRESVTLYGSGPVRVVLDERDALAEAEPEVPEAVRCEWVAGEDAFRGRRYARLTLERDGRFALTLRPRHLHPLGCQLFAYAARCSGPQASCGFLIATRSGGRFLFADPGLGEIEGEVTARYEFPASPVGQWRLRAAPFWDMRWSPGARPGGAMPSHEVASLRLLVRGRARDRVDLDRVEFVRPSSAGNARPGTRHVVGGQVLGAAPAGTRVRARYDADGRRREIATSLDHPRGLFAFTGIPYGALVEIVCLAGGDEWCADAGREVEVRGDDLSLIVRAPGRAGAADA